MGRESTDSDTESIRDSVSQGHIRDVLKTTRFGEDSPLPLELIEMILEIIPDISDVLRLRQVSKAFCGVIDGSASLQYRMELLLGGVEDTGVSSLALGEKRQLLAEYLSRRVNLREDVREKNFVDLGDEGMWHVNNGFLCRYSTYGASALQFPSPSRGVPAKEWVLENGVLDMFEIDVSQDLILIEHCEEFSFSVEALSLSSRKRHPASTCDSFTIEAPMPSPDHSASAFLTILKDQVLVGFFYPDRSFIKLTLMNWKTGAMIRTLSETEFSSYLLLDEDHILLSSICPAANAPKISIINVHNPRLPTISLLFPEFQQCDFELFDHHYYVKLSAGPRSDSSFIQHPTSCPFRLATTDKIITLAVYTGASDEKVFIVPSWIVQREIVRARAEVKSDSEEEILVSWDSWGPRGTAFVSDLQGAIRSGDCSTSGTTYIMKEQGKVVLCDFNRFALRRDAIFGPTHPSAITSGPQEVRCDFFKDPISACLPWRKFTTELSVDDDSLVGLVHDSVLVFHRDELSMFEAIVATSI